MFNHQIKLMGTKVKWFLNSIRNWKKHYEFLKLEEDLNKDSIYLFIHYKYYDLWVYNTKILNSRKKLPTKYKNFYERNVKLTKQILILSKRIYERNYLENVCWYQVDIDDPKKVSMGMKISPNLVFKRNERYWATEHFEDQLEQDKFLLFKTLLKHEESIINK